MNFKVFVTAFIGLLAVNASVQSPTVKDDSIKKIVVEVFNEVLSANTALLGKADKYIDNFEKNQDEIKDEIVAHAVSVGKGINNFILKEIDELRKGATDDGKAVIDCVDYEQPKSEAAFTKVFVNIGTCIAGENPKVITEVRTILSQLNDLVTDVKGQTGTLSSCTDSELTCLSSFVSNIFITVKKVPAVIISDYHDIVELTKIIASDIKDCAGDFVKEVESDIQAIFNEAIVCIKK